MTKTTTTTLPADELEEDLERDVACEYKRCERPADMQVRMHLPLRKTDPTLGCETRTVFVCSGCLDDVIRRTCARLPFHCFCGHTAHLVSDVVLWTRSLR